jgi:hypothetical protein
MQLTDRGRKNNAPRGAPFFNPVGIGQAKEAFINGVCHSTEKQRRTKKMHF